MKVLQFTIPVAHDKAVIVQEDEMPYFYPHLHRHNEAQLIWIKNGAGTLLIDTQMHAFKQDDIFLIGANQPHLFKSNAANFLPESELKINALMIFFDPNGILAPLLALPEMYLIKNYLQANQCGLRISIAQHDQVVQKMLAVQQSKNHGLIIAFLQLLNVLQQVESNSQPLSVNAPKAFSETEGIRIGHVFNYLMQEYDKQITLAEVAAQAHMTPQAFCRYFKKHTRQTFVAFLNEIRINEACKKLTNGNFENISAVAYAVGFNSLTNFNRVFKNTIGTSPKSYLSSYLNKIEKLG